jgi:hypothetical protein
VVPRVIHFVSKVLWRLRIDYGEGFPDTAFVIAANHSSFLDPPIVGGVFRRRVRFLTLGDLFGNYRLLDLALRTFEVIEVRRGAIPLGALRQALDHLGEGGVVAVFPEGTRAWRFGEITSSTAAGSECLSALRFIRKVRDGSRRRNSLIGGPSGWNRNSIVEVQLVCHNLRDDSQRST